MCYCHTQALGQEGRVLEVDSDGDAVVLVGTRLWLFNPAALTLETAGNGTADTGMLLGDWTYRVPRADRSNVSSMELWKKNKTHHIKCFIDTLYRPSTHVFFWNDRCVCVSVGGESSVVEGQSPVWEVVGPNPFTPKFKKYIHPTL